MKKAVKITNWVFVIGLVLIMMVVIGAEVQEYMERINPPAVPELPVAYDATKLFFWTSLFLWSAVYGIARLILYAWPKSPEK